MRLGIDAVADDPSRRLGQFRSENIDQRAHAGAMPLRGGSGKQAPRRSEAPQLRVTISRDAQSDPRAAQYRAVRTALSRRAAGCGA